jgi:hypothetical protein
VDADWFHERLEIGDVGRTERDDVCIHLVNEKKIITNRVRVTEQTLQNLRLQELGFRASMGI